MPIIANSDSARRLFDPDSPDNPYRLGWRDVYRLQPNGKTEHLQIPLSLEDCLHPQPGDTILTGTLHFRIRSYLANVFRYRLANDPTALVLSNTGVYWDEPALKHHSPDIAVIFDVREQQVDWEDFHVAEQGTRPRLIIEVASPNFRENDVVTKVRHYHQAKVQDYVIVDDVNDKLALIGYHYAPTSYEPMPTDGSGRLWLEPVGLWLGLKSNGVALYDGKTGAEFGDYSTVTKERDAARARVNAASVRADELAALAQATSARSDVASDRQTAEKRIRELEEQIKRQNADPSA